MKQPRPYQREAIDSLYAYWKQPGSGDGIIVMPTGSGKSLLLAILCHELCTKWAGTRILILSHVKELISQDHDEIKEYWPEAPIGIFSAGIGRKDFQAQIMVAGIQSIAKHAHNLYPCPEICIVDECHLIPRNESTRYHATIKLLKQMNPNMRVVGLSATPYRLDSGWLHLGENKLFDSIVYEVPLQSLIDQKYLCPVVTRLPKVSIDYTGVKHSGGEFIAGELEAKAMEGDTTELAVVDMVDRGKDRNKWLVFTCGLKHAAQVSEALTRHGIRNEVITGETNKKDRDRIIDEFKNGSLDPIRALVSVGVLTTGFNVPAVDFLALMRPTESVGLYVQCVGRGMRLYPGKENCLVADYAGLTLKHGPIDAVDPDRKPWSPGQGVPPAKECPTCTAIIFAGLRVCPHCGHEFPPSEYKINNKPSEAPILKSQIEPEEYDVTHTEYVIHRKEGKKESVRVNYSHAFGTISEWIFPEAATQWANFYYRKACREMGLSEPYPETAAEFVDRLDLPQAEKIWTIPDGKHTRVKKHQWKAKEVVEYTDEIPF